MAYLALLPLIDVYTDVLLSYMWSGKVKHKQRHGRRPLHVYLPPRAVYAWLPTADSHVYNKREIIAEFMDQRSSIWELGAE